MNKTQLSELAGWVQGHVHGSDASFNAVNIDSRTLAPGQLFWALRGLQFDGHDFIKMAEQKGAVACVVDKPIDTALPSLIVSDTHQALGVAATYYRQQFHIPVIAITGSCGKTTTKALLASILGLIGPTLYPEQSFNNDIGLPLTLLRLEAEHQFAVLELGTNHPGEIATITAIAQPTIAGITNIGPVHLEGFGSIEAIAQEKRSIFNGLVPQGTAIINVDEPLISEHTSNIQAGRFITFGLHKPAQISAQDLKLDSEGKLSFILVCPHGKGLVNLQLLGLHNINNALFSAAAAYALDVPFETIVQGLETSEPVNKRMNRLQGHNGSVIINDSYNANPTALFAAIDLLANYHGKKVLVLADMGELGQDAADYHKQVGLKAKAAGLDALYTTGTLSEQASLAFGKAAKHYQDRNLLIADLKLQLRSNVTVLVKGSNSQKMWEVANALID